MKQVDKLMQQAISDNVFPGGVLLVAEEDSVVFTAAYGQANIFSKRLMTRGTIFDLASLTKPLATTLAVMKLVEQKKLSFDQSIGATLFPFKNTDKSKITVKHLLRHDSGLSDYRPYYKALCKLSPKGRKDALRDFLVKELLICPAGQRVLYSDLGFMILGWIVEQVAGKRLDRFVTEEIYRPIGLGLDSDPGLFFCGS